MNPDSLKYFQELIDEGDKHKYRTVNGFLLMACYFEKKHGYESQAMFEKGESLLTTKARVKNFFDDDDGSFDWDEIRDDLIRVNTKVEDIKKYIKDDLPTVPPEDRMYNYYNDLREVYRSDPDHQFQTSASGLIVSGLGLYNANSDHDVNSKHLGTLGVSNEWFVKLTHFRLLDSGSYLYKVVNRVGDHGMFYSKNGFGIEIGDCFQFKGTVKKHDNWKGTNTTQWNYIRIRENVGKVDE